MRRCVVARVQNLLHEVQDAVDAKSVLAAAPFEQRHAFLRALREDVERHHKVILSANQHDCEVFARQHSYAVRSYSAATTNGTIGTIKASWGGAPAGSGQDEAVGSNAESATVASVTAAMASCSSHTSLYGGESPDDQLHYRRRYPRQVAMLRRLTPLRLDKLFAALDYYLAQPDPLELPMDCWLRRTQRSESSNTSLAAPAVMESLKQGMMNRRMPGSRQVECGGCLPNSDPQINVCEVTVPLGLIGVLSRYRTRMCLDAAATGILAGNVVLLDGGASVHNTNLALMSSVRRALMVVSLPLSSVVYVEGYDAGHHMTIQWLQLADRVDVGIVCGSAKLFDFAAHHSSIPLIRATERSCSLYVDQSASYDTALQVILNSKLQSPGAANSLNTVIIHEEFPRYHELLSVLHQNGLVLLGDYTARERASDCIHELASEEEYRGLSETFANFSGMLCVKTVKNLNQALFFLELFGSKQSDGIIATDEDVIEKYAERVESAVVLVNASTRLSSGMPLGCGADIALVTSKVHCRGPLTLPMLTTRKFLVRSKDPHKGALRK